MPLDMRGGRHYGGSDRQRAVLDWECPACGEKISGTPFGEGCPKCGNGAPGTHVGIDPIVRPGDKPVASVSRALLENQTGGQAQSSVITLSEMDAAFLAWQKRASLPTGVSVDVLLHLAFIAGYQAAEARVVNEVKQPLAGTAESRTIVAALRLFVENVLSANPEEAQTGEWLTVGQAEQLIARLEAGS